MTKLSLPDVTLVCITGVDFDNHRRAFDRCLELVEFGAARFVFDTGINSIEEYSRVIFRELGDHFSTSHCLLIQSDGYILEPSAWDPNWLTYDYIGAPWGHRGNMVGNGGFSLRSRRLCADLASGPYDVETHPEDDKICRKYGPALERGGIKFAPPEVGELFSYEANGYRRLATSVPFGGHGLPKLSTGTDLKAIMSVWSTFQAQTIAQARRHMIGLGYTFMD